MCTTWAIPAPAENICVCHVIPFILLHFQSQPLVTTLSRNFALNFEPQSHRKSTRQKLFNNGYASMLDKVKAECLCNKWPRFLGYKCCAQSICLFSFSGRMKEIRQASFSHSCDEQSQDPRWSVRCGYRQYPSISFIPISLQVFRTLANVTFADHV